MNKAQLVAVVARDCRLTKADVNRVLGAIVDHVTRMLKKGERVTLVGFGTFLVSRRRTRMGRNPQNGLPIRIVGRRFPRFAAGKGLKKVVR